MSKLPAISPDDCIKVLMKAGFVVSRQRGSHVQMRRNVPPPARTVPIATGKKTLPRGTLSAIIRQAGMTRDELMDLLE